MNFKLVLSLAIAMGVQHLAMGQAGISVNAAAGGGTGSAFGSLGLQAGVGIGAADRLVLGGGVRSTYAHSADRDLKAINPGSDANGTSIRAEKFNQVNAALYVWATYVVLPKLQVGFNMDLFGGTVGSKTNAVVNDGLGTKVQVSPGSASIQKLNNNSMGLLQGQYFVGYEIIPKTWLRAGIAHEHVELRASSKPSGQERFGSFINAWFVGITIPLGRAEPIQQ